MWALQSQTTQHSTALVFLLTVHQNQESGVCGWWKRRRGAILIYTAASCSLLLHFAPLPYRITCVSLYYYPRMIVQNKCQACRLVGGYVYQMSMSWKGFSQQKCSYHKLEITWGTSSDCLHVQGCQIKYMTPSQISHGTYSYYKIICCLCGIYISLHSCLLIYCTWQPNMEWNSS